MKGRSALVCLLAFAALWLGLRLPWLDCDAGVRSAWEYGYNVTDEGYYLVGGKEKLLRGRFVDLPRAETATYGYAPGLHYLSYAAHLAFGLSDWKWRIPFVAVNFAAWIALFLALARRIRPPGALAVCAAFSCVPLVVAYERTASNDVLIGSLLVLACACALGRARWRAFAPAALLAPVILVKPSVWVLLPIVLCAVLAERKLRSRLLDAVAFLASFALALGLLRLGVHLATLPDAAANGVSVSEILSRMKACYPLPDMTDVAQVLKGLSTFPRDPSSTLLGPLAVLLVPIPLVLACRRWSWRTAFLLFIPPYVGAVSVMNTIYTHYFIPVLALLPLAWAEALRDLDDDPSAAESVRPLADDLRALAMALGVFAALALPLVLSLCDPPRPGPETAELYSRIYNLPSRNVWTCSALPALAFAAAVVAVTAAVGWRRGARTQGLVAAAIGALGAGSVAFAVLPAVRMSPALRASASTYLAPLALSLLAGALLVLVPVALPRLFRRFGAWIPAGVVVASYLAIPSWRSAAVELLAPGTHFHREAAAKAAAVLPPDAIVLGERADQLLMSVPVRTSSTFIANSDGTLTAEDILAAEPDAKLYLLADPQHSYNIRHFLEHRDRFRLHPVAKLRLPSFATGDPVDVTLCRIEVLEKKGS